MAATRYILTFTIIASLLGCADNKPTAIVVSIATDLEIPKELDQLTLTVEQQNKEQANLSYWLDPQKENHVDLPATITIVAGKKLDEPVLISVVGKLKSSDVVQRKAKLSFIKDKVLLLRMDLLQSCVNATNCENGQTCTENGCQSIQVDSSLLPEYDPSKGPIGLDAGTDFANDGSSFDSVTSETSPPDIGPKDIQLSDSVDSCISCDSTTKNDSAPPITWTTVTSGTANNLNGIWGKAHDNIWAVGDFGTILRYNGIDWYKISPTPTGFQLNAVWGSAANYVWAVGDTNTIMVNYNGSNWIPITLPPGTAIDLKSIWGSAANDVWAVGVTNPPLYFLHFNGNYWSLISCPICNTNTYAVWGTASNNIWAVGGGAAYGNIVRYSNSVWSQHTNFPSAGTIRATWGNAANDIWAVGDYGKIYHYNGLSWTNISSTATTSTLNGIWGSSANDIWAVGASGTILHYYGNAWTNISSTATTSTLNAVWGSSANDVWAVGAGGVILHRSP